MTENLKNATSPLILDLCLRKLGQGNHVIIVTSSFSKSFPRENEELAFSNSSGLKSVFKKFRFGDGLVYGR